MMEAMYFRGLEVVKKYFLMKSNREATDRYNFVNFFVDQNAGAFVQGILKGEVSLYH
jgi:hypothetical protein